MQILTNFRSNNHPTVSRAEKIIVAREYFSNSTMHTRNCIKIRTRITITCAHMNIHSVLNFAVHKCRCGLIVFHFCFCRFSARCKLFPGRISARFSHFSGLFIRLAFRIRPSIYHARRFGLGPFIPRRLIFFFFPSRPLINSYQFPPFDGRNLALTSITTTLINLGLCN